jgi:tetratricopeptide (TPR) repeat protein
LVAELTQPIDPTGATAVFELESRSRPTAMAYGASIVTLLDGSEILVFDLTGHEDALAQAARCALFIQAHRPAARLALAIGKAEHSGSSVVGRVIDEASLLLHAATPGNIIVDETTAEVLGSSFRLDRIGAHARLLAEPDETALHTLLGKPSRFVGRTREQSWLMGLFHQVIEESHAGAVVIVAPPGVGKTRLWREFTHAIVRGHDPLLLLIRCSVTLQGSPFAALGAALRREAGVVGSDSIEQARARILARFTPTVEQPATAKQAAYIADLCGINVDDGGTEMLALARRNPTELAGAQRLAALDWMQAEAQLRPLVIVVEDLHWCDDMTAEFVRSAVRELADCPLMMVATARPEVAARFPTPWPTPESELLSLAPLNARASEALVRQALGPTAANVIEHAVARAEGNPFFLEELVRTLRTNPSSTLPDRVLSVVQTRLLRLEDEQRRLLRAASVFGSAFDPRGVAWLLGNPMHDVTAMLERLIDEEVLSRDPTAESTTYRFRHALVGDAAYAMLSDADRPSAHLAAAEWLVAGGYEPAEIATHFTRGNEPRIAGEWWVRAARRALICSDVNATASYVERALDGGVTGDLLAEVRVVQGEVAIWLGDIATADRRAREGLALAAPGSVVWFTALRRAINCAYLTVRMPEVRELTARLQPFHGGRSSAYLFCVAEAAYILGVSGAVDEGRALSDGIEDLDDPTMSPLVRAAIHHARAAISSHDQQLWSGLVELERAIACYEHAADIRTAGRVRATLAWLFLSLGAPLRAEQCVREALPVAQRVSAGHTLLYLEAALSLALSRQGRIDEAKLLMTAVAHRARDAGEARLSGYIVIWHVTLDAETVPSNATIAGLREGLEHLRPFASTHLWASATLAVMLARRGEPSELREALALVHVGLGRLREFTSLLDDEFSVWSNFVEVLERGGAPEPADVATIEALRRVSRLHAQIDDESMRQAFAAYDPVVRLRDRARRRDLALPAA